MAEEKAFQEWCIVELLGHRRLAGLVTEQQIAGGGFMRIDIPTEPPMSQLFRPESVYCLTPTTEEMARAVAVHNAPTPVNRWELPAPKHARELDGSYNSDFDPRDDEERYEDGDELDS